ncbi:protein kinase [Gemmata sp. JC717]|uniref:protein kinase domain-containing protein n=1 Tax=Gemmata algarum TaxID=2975278 RepID=UPI0021BB99AA|nr:protein kinase [Gemmata algarum]MDY3552370.1 protein kinase [Gemmata algarum]
MATVTGLIDPPLAAPAALAESLKRAWRAGADPDAAAALAEHPVLLDYQSLVIDLAYEEYCLREEAGPAPAVAEFAARFPAHEALVREVLDGHRQLADHPELLAAAPAWPQPGDRFEQLVVVRELGRGAFARVYLANDPDAGGRSVVLKLTPGPSREAHFLGGIAHPHIVPVLWARQSGGFAAVCMPFVGETTLRDIIAGPAPLGLDRRVELAARLAGAVEHLHRAGLVHGDLKPSNVIVAPDGRPYLIDFNLCADLAAPAHRCGGTLPYMPPEWLRVVAGGGTAVPATTADVYSFGVLLFELLTGHVPAEPGTTDSARAAAELLQRSTAPRAPVAPAALAGLVRRCLDPVPDRRPEIGRVRVALERHLARRARRCAVAAVALAVVLGGLVAVALTRRSVEPPSAGPTLPARNAPEVPPELRHERPATAAEHFERGRRELRDGYFSAALKSFEDADRLEPSGRNAAYLAYAHSLAANHLGAAELYRRAIRADFAPAWVRNNLARALLQSGGTRAKLSSARTEVAAALELVSDLPAARLNRAYVRFRLVLGSGYEVSDDPAARDDIEAALAGPAESAEMYTNAALVLLTFGGGKENPRARAVWCLKQAIRLGRPPARLLTDPIFQKQLGAKERAELGGLTPGPAVPAAPDPHLVCPPLNSHTFARAGAP